MIKCDFSHVVKETTPYDCHIVVLRQILSDNLYLPYIFYGALFNLQPFSGSVACHHALDAESGREQLLQEAFGVYKINLPLNSNIKGSLNTILAEQGYCICRLDTAYMTYFENYVAQWDKFKRILAHKVLLLELTDGYCKYIDSVGSGIHIYSMPLQLFLQAIISGILARYDKSDYSYYYHIESTSLALTTRDMIRDRFNKFLQDQLIFHESIKQLLNYGKSLLNMDRLENLLADSPMDIRTAWVNNLILVSNKMHLCYQLLIESFDFCQEFVLEDYSRSKEFLSRIKNNVRYWGHLKLLAQRNLYYLYSIDKSVITMLESIYQNEVKVALVKFKG